MPPTFPNKRGNAKPLRLTGHFKMHHLEDPLLYDVAIDLADSIKGLPKDFATNSKYMEGFGR
jgi:hypothetical protein